MDFKKAGLLMARRIAERDKLPVGSPEWKKAHKKVVKAFFARWKHKLGA